jgi:hypothetical protein
MSRFAEDAAARIVRSLSASFKKKVAIVDSASADAARSFALTPATSIQFEQPLSATSRELVDEIASLVRFADDRDERVRELQEQLSDLEAVNSELLSRNSALSEISARDALTGLYNRW